MIDGRRQEAQGGESYRMSKSMLVNVAAEEEYRVAVVDNGVLDLFEIETLSRENIKGNIFKAVVEGVNTALEAAFVNYGGERAAFLPLDEINFKIYPARFDGGAAKGRGARITRHLEKGMEILVQVVRDAFANKPPTLSTYYSLPGRYLVLMPGADAAGISRKIEDEQQRVRLRQVLEGLTIPEGYGVIVRTAGMETSPRELQADLDALLELWRNIERAAADAKAPSLIYQERDLVIRTARDHFTSDMTEVLIDDEPTWKRLHKFFEAHMPEKADLVREYTGDRPIFSRHNIEDQIERIYKREVSLKSGGSISVDQTEALTAVDVNSARSVRGGSSEETATRTNLEAAEEIARQLRLRDIGGLIVIDFIDMESSRHVRQVERAFAQAMTRDKARYDLTRISKLGLMEVSRQRLKAAKSASSFKKCPVCAGDGMVRTPEAAARSAYRKIQARVARGGLAGVKVYLPPDVALYLLNQKRDDLFRLETRQKLRIEVNPQENMKVEQFEIEEIRREEQDSAPMVTADAVDQAIAEGTLQAPIVGEIVTLQPFDRAAVGGGESGSRTSERPREARAEGDRGDQAGRGRRRRRRGRRGGRPEETHRRQGARQPGAGPAAAPEPTGPEPAEDRPVFSEGPEDEAAPPEAASAEGAEEGTPPTSEPPSHHPGRDHQKTHLAEGQGDGRPGHRRRRRRRSRGRGRGRVGEVNATTGPGAGAPRPPSEDDNIGNRLDPAEIGSEGWRPAQEPRAFIPPPSAGRSIFRADAAGKGGAPPPVSAPNEPSADTKPKRRWWRRGNRG
jgi:ribonuclease E